MNADGKVTVPKEVAESIEYAVNVHSSLTNVMDDVFNCRGGSDYKMRILADYFDGDERGLMSALVNGYQVEKTPEDVLSVRYHALHEIYTNESDEHTKEVINAEIYGIFNTVQTLGITIEGINDK